MMNEIIRSLQDRKSVRIYEDKPVESAVKEILFDAAAQAPTAGCQQLYTILDITDQAVKEQLAVLCDNQPFIAKAPLALVFLADCRRWLDSYRYAGAEARDPGMGDLMLAVSDAVIAAQNTVVAAQALGLGSCYIGDIMENSEQVRELLHLDPFIFPATMVVYGYPTQAQKDRPKPRRFERKYIVQENAYRRLTPEEHLDMHAAVGHAGGKPVEEYLAAFCKRKYMSDFSREMTRSVELYLREFESKE